MLTQKQECCFVMREVTGQKEIFREPITLDTLTTATKIAYRFLLMQVNPISYQLFKKKSNLYANFSED